MRGVLSTRRAAAIGLAVLAGVAHLAAVAVGVPEARGPAITPGVGDWEVFSWVVAAVRVLIPLAGAALLLTVRDQLGVVVLVASAVLAVPGLATVLAPGMGPATVTGALWLVSVLAMLGSGAVAWTLRARRRWAWATPVSPVLAIAGLALLVGEALPRVGLHDWPMTRPQLAVGGELETLGQWGLTLVATLVVLLMAAWLERPLAGGALLVLAVPTLGARLYDLYQATRAPLELLPGGWLSLAAAVVLSALAVRWLLLPPGVDRPAAPEDVGGLQRPADEVGRRRS